MENLPNIFQMDSSDSQAPPISTNHSDILHDIELFEGSELNRSMLNDAALELDSNSSIDENSSTPRRGSAIRRKTKERNQRANRFAGTKRMALLENAGKFRGAKREDLYKTEAIIDPALGRPVEYEAGPEEYRKARKRQ